MSEKHERGFLRAYIRDFMEFISSEKRDIGYVYFLSVLTSLVGILMPLGFQLLTNIISGGVWFTSLFTGIGLVILIVLLNGVMVITQYNVIEKIQQRLFARVSVALTERMPHLKTAATSVIPDYQKANHFIEIALIQKTLPKMLIDFPSAILQLVLGLVLLCFYHLYFALPVLFLIMVSVWVVTHNIRRGIETSYQESKYKYQIYAHFQRIYQRLNGYKLNGFDQYIMHHTDQHIFNYNNYRKKHYQILQNQYLFFVAFKVLVAAMLIIVGAWLVINGDINLGQFVASEIIVLMLIGAIEKFIAYYDAVYDSLISVHKLNALLKHPVNENLSLSAGTSVKAEDIKQVTLMQGGRSIQINPTQNYILEVSSKDQGVQMVKQLLLLNDEDQIHINGVPSRDINTAGYKNWLGSVSRFDVVLEAGLLENMTLQQEDIPLTAIAPFIDLCALGKYVSEKGLQYKIVPEAEEINLGFRFKVLLARALYHKPHMLLIDDKYSHLLDADMIAKITQVTHLLVIVPSEKKGSHFNGFQSL